MRDLKVFSEALKSRVMDFHKKTPLDPESSFAYDLAIFSVSYINSCFFDSHVFAAKRDIKHPLCDAIHDIGLKFPHNSPHNYRVPIAISVTIDNKEILLGHCVFYFKISEIGSTTTGRVVRREAKVHDIEITPIFLTPFLKGNLLGFGRDKALNIAAFRHICSLSKENKKKQKNQKNQKKVFFTQAEIDFLHRQGNVLGISNDDRMRILLEIDGRSLPASDDIATVASVIPTAPALPARQSQAPAIKAREQTPPSQKNNAPKKSFFTRMYESITAGFSALTTSLKKTYHTVFPEKTKTTMQDVFARYREAHKTTSQVKKQTEDDETAKKEFDSIVLAAKKRKAEQEQLQAAQRKVEEEQQEAQRKAVSEKTFLEELNEFLKKIYNTRDIELLRVDSDRLERLLSPLRTSDKSSVWYASCKEKFYLDELTWSFKYSLTKRSYEKLCLPVIARILCLPYFAAFRKTVIETHVTIAQSSTDERQQNARYFLSQVAPERLFEINEKEKRLFESVEAEKRVAITSEQQDFFSKINSAKWYDKNSMLVNKLTAIICETDKACVSEKIRALKNFLVVTKVPILLPEQKAMLSDQLARISDDALRSRLQLLIDVLSTQNFTRDQVSSAVEQLIAHVYDPNRSIISTNSAALLHSFAGTQSERAISEPSVRSDSVARAFLP